MTPTKESEQMIESQYILFYRECGFLCLISGRILTRRSAASSSLFASNIFPSILWYCTRALTSGPRGAGHETPSSAKDHDLRTGMWLREFDFAARRRTWQSNASATSVAYTSDMLSSSACRPFSSFKRSITPLATSPSPKAKAYNR
eukprot:2993302-Rhodomonas_salina.1